MPRHPDIEIYLPTEDSQQIIDWLASVFEQLEVTHRGNKGNLRGSAVLKGSTTEFMWLPRAEGNFGSLWFKQNNTPWDTDLDCARQAHQELELSVRCAPAGWQDGEPEDLWVQIKNGREEKGGWDSLQ